MTSSHRFVLSIVCAVLLVLLGTNANAAEYHWQGAGTGGNTATDPSYPTTQWDNPSNWWEGSVPNVASTTYIALTNRGYCNVMSGTGAQAQTVWVEVEGITPEGALHIGEGMDFQVEGKEVVANRATGKIVQTGGNHRVFCNSYANVYLGYTSGSSGTYELSGGEFTVESIYNYECRVHVGYYGTGTFLQTGGTHNIRNADYSGRGHLYVGHQQGSAGLYSLSGGDLIVDGTEYIGYYSAGEFVQTGGTNMADEIYLGRYEYSSGSYELAGDGSVSATKLIMAYASGTTASFSIAGSGSVSVSELTMAYDASSGFNATASFSIAGNGSVSVNELTMACDYYSSSNYTTAMFSLSESGSLTARQEVIGQEGRGTFNQSGGTHTVASIMTLGYESTAVGTYDLTGGLLNPSGMTLGLNGTGTCTQSGGTNSVAGELHLGHNSGGEGAYYLSEGTLNVGTSEYVGLRGNGTMTQTGGTHTVTERLCLGYDTGSHGTLIISGGSLVAGDLHVGRLGYAELSLSSGAYLEVTNTLTFGGNSRFFADAGSEIHMTGAAFENESTNGYELPGLGNLKMIFEGGSGVVDPFEAAAEDMMGAVGAGVFATANFLLDTLQLGGTAAGRIQLVDDFDNQADGIGVGEAVYVNTLIMNAGATIDLSGLNLYYLNGGDPKRFFCGDANLDGGVNVGDLGILAGDYGQTEGMVWAGGDFTGDGAVNVADMGVLAANYGATESAIPEPASAVLLLSGGVLAMFRRRKK